MKPNNIIKIRVPLNYYCLLQIFASKRFPQIKHKHILYRYRLHETETSNTTLLGLASLLSLVFFSNWCETPAKSTLLEGVLTGALPRVYLPFGEQREGWHIVRCLSTSLWDLASLLAHRLMSRTARMLAHRPMSIHPPLRPNILTSAPPRVYPPSGNSEKAGTSSSVYPSPFKAQRSY